ncbi:Gfo/Idh/MocA family protein [Costertonia aggregata]|uniref:Gfo/Idh/MocA family oxidoreductase n=1 Tax=Costertonia aggregata TaxID=343403 RepID=A0A7H9AQC0_9FLAO|nr:Gfo/Idh/MocA family oxidoreductase [Costertonia aggregata]QLG45644.1 Gfo/Idh/MocA family oxidoreductase [Costertonia aggregata]
MKSSNIIRWGVIGCGAVTEIKSVPAYQKTKGFEVVAVMRRDFEKAKDYAQRHGIPKVHPSAVDLIHDDGVDAVYIATPPDSHKTYALKVAEAGKPCCIEKPMAPSYEESLDIYKMFKVDNIPLFVSYYRRSLPRFLKINEWLNTHQIGKIRHIRWFLSKPPNPLDLSKNYNWRTDAKIAPGGYFDDLASHGLDLFTFLLGDIEFAQGVVNNQQGLYSAMDSVSANWLHKSGVMGSGSWNFGCDRREDKVEIYGSHGKITFSVFGEEDIVLENGKGKQSLFIENPENVQLYHTKNIKEHLLGNQTHPSTGKTALHTSWVMNNILSETN